MNTKKKLAYVVLIAIAAIFPALGACYERAIENQAPEDAQQETLQGAAPEATR